KEVNSLKESNILDYSCGTGIYLRTVLRTLQLKNKIVKTIEIIKNCLFGLDIDPRAIIACRFVLLVESLLSNRSRVTPVYHYELISKNIQQHDSLLVDPVISDEYVYNNSANGRIHLNS